jgi:protein-tyrosine phosphatase
MQTKILMVCLGNICRSPLAEGILKSKVNPQRIIVDSAGTAGYHIGSNPDSRSIAVAKKNNIHIASQRCRKFVSKDLADFDLIYAMDLSNYNDILSLAKNEEQEKKIRLLLNEVDSDLQEVPDPYYGGEEGFDFVFKLINEACEVIANKLNI